MDLYVRRRFGNMIVLTLSMIATVVGLLWLAAILWTLISSGVTALSLTLFTETTPPPGSKGGLMNAMYGSLIMTLVGTVVGTPVGILPGTFLAAYGRGSRLPDVIRFINDILLTAPSIIVGLFVYEVMVIRMGHFSAWAGAVALAILVIPVVLRTTEDMLHLIPDALREAAAALGTPKWRIVTMICYRAALQGLVTGVMLAVAPISGANTPP